MLWGMQGTTLLPSFPNPHWPGMVVPDRVLFMGQIELNGILMLNWITWNRTVFDIKTVLMLNWIVWIRTVWPNYMAWNRIFFDLLLKCVLMTWPGIEPQSLGPLANTLTKLN